MTTDLHDSLAQHRISPTGLLWPSTVATVLFVGTLFVAWVYSAVIGSMSGQELADTVWGHAAFLWAALIAAVLLLGFAMLDVRRHTDRVWRVPRLVIGACEIVLLSATIAMLVRALSVAG